MPILREGQGPGWGTPGELINPMDPSTWHPDKRAEYELWLQIFGGQGGGGGSSSSSTTNTNQLQRIDRSTFPFILPEYSPLMGLVRGQIEQRLRFPQALSPEYRAQGIQNVNRTMGTIQQALGNKLSAMGISGSPAGTYPVAVFETGRGQAIADFQNRLPELARQQQTQDLGLAQALAEIFGKGTRETGTVRTTGTSTTQGRSSGGGGGPSDLQRYLQQSIQARAEQGQQGGDPWWRKALDAAKTGAEIAFLISML